MKEVLFAMGICVAILSIGAILHVALIGESIYEEKENTKIEEIIRRVIKEEIKIHGRI